MKINRTIYYHIAFSLSIVLTSSSCKKFVDVGSPKAELTTDKVFVDSSGAAAAITGIYLSPGLSSGRMTVAAGLSADELTTSSQDANAEFLNNNIKPANSSNAGLWSSAYQQIYQANACIEGVAASKGLSTDQKDRLLAEARFLRAFLYFNLTDLYSSIPLVTMTNYQESRSLPRTDQAVVYKQIISDLQFSQAHLNNDGVDVRRGNYYAATALLARVYLYQKNYELAAAEASKVISSGHFSLMDEPDQVFLATSKEAIWRLVPVTTGRETWEASLFVPSTVTAIPAYVITDDLRLSFSSSDKRRSQWLASNTVSGKQYFYPFKYKKVFSSGAPTESYVVLRLSEQYLIRAEARANVGDVAGAVADLNVVQKRAGAVLYTGSAASFAAALENEKRKEYFCEWGSRWSDLKRTARADAVLGASKANWKPSASLYPVPQVEINSNSALTQNPGY
jgi:starch-binding outer membrane protein, SusD/RagB family